MKDLKDVCKIALVQAAPVMFDKKLVNYKPKKRRAKNGKKRN